MKPTNTADRPWHLSYQGGCSQETSWSQHGMPYLFPAFLDLVRSSTPGVHLDVGCGNGVKTAAFAAAGLQAVGVDISTDALISASQTSYVQAPRYACARGEALPFRDQSIASISDILMCTHLDEVAWPRYFREIRRVLKDGGYVVLVLFSMADLHFHGHPVSRRYTFRYDPANPTMLGFAHYHGMVNVHFDLADIQTAFANGFDIVEAVQVQHPVYTERFLWNVILHKPMPSV